MKKDLRAVKGGWEGNQKWELKSTENALRKKSTEKST